MSETATSPNRKARRARRPRPTVREQRKASLMHEVSKVMHEEPAEPQHYYFIRVRDRARSILREKRAADRRAVRAARKANR